MKTCFGFITFRNNFDFHAQKCCNEKTLWENQKKQNHGQVSLSFKNSFIKNVSKGVTLTVALKYIYNCKTLSNN